MLQAINYLDLNSAVIVNYCDFNCIWDYQEFLKYVRKTNCDGSVVTYTGFHPHMLYNTNYAYVKLDNSQIIDIKEKKWELLSKKLTKSMEKRSNFMN